MAKCELIERCPFFSGKMVKTASAEKLFDSFYCRSDNSNCARYMVFKALGPGKVPPDLYPNQVERVPEIVDSDKIAKS